MRATRIGRYLNRDSRGFIVPDVSDQGIKSPWREAVNDVVKTLEREGAATSVFIRGSVPRGLAIEGVSDLDFIYYSEVKTPQLELELEKRFESMFPFIKGIELVRIDNDLLNLKLGPQTRPYFQMLLKTQSLFLSGNDLTKNIEPFKIDLNMCSHAFEIGAEFTKMSKWLDEDRQKNTEVETIKWFYRRLVRAGFEICLDRLDHFTRDLYLCYEDFVRMYPEHNEAMARALDGALNGNSDPLLETELISLVESEKTRLLPLQ